MARPQILATTFILLFVAAYAYRTTTITVETEEAEEENRPRQSQKQRCRQQIQSQQELNACQQYLRESSRITILETVLNQNGWREQFPKCCQQLEQLDESCRCDGIRSAVQQQKGELRGAGMQEMLETAESLLSLCRISPRGCDVRSVLRF